MAQSRYKEASGPDRARSELDAVLDEIETGTTEARSGALVDSAVESDDEEELEEAGHAEVRESGRMRRRQDSSDRDSAGPLDVPEDSDGLRRGAVVAGKYKIGRLVGQVGTIVELSAVHVELDQSVTLKYVLSAGASRGESVAQFLRGARATAQIQSDHVVRVLDVGRFRSGRPFVVTESLDGWTLDEVLRVRGPLPVQEAVEYCIQISDAVAEAHGLGVLHRSLHPGNIVLTRRADESPALKVLNFGIDPGVEHFVRSDAPRASVRSSAGRNAYPSALAYISPEQIRGGVDVDERSDIWALGSLLHAFLAGRPAFRAATAIALLAAISADEPPSLGEIRDDVAPELEAVVRRCLAKDRAARFADVSEFALALSQFASGDALRSIERVQRLTGRATRPPPLPTPRARAIVPSQRPPATVAPVAARAVAPPRAGSWWFLTAIGGVCIGALAAMIAGRSQRFQEDAAPKAAVPSPAGMLPAPSIPAATVSAAVVAPSPVVPAHAVAVQPARTLHAAEKPASALSVEQSRVLHHPEPAVSQAPQTTGKSAPEAAPSARGTGADLFDDTR